MQGLWQGHDINDVTYETEITNNIFLPLGTAPGFLLRDAPLTITSSAGCARHVCLKMGGFNVDAVIAARCISNRKAFEVQKVA